MTGERRFPPSYWAMVVCVAAAGILFVGRFAFDWSSWSAVVAAGLIVVGSLFGFRFAWVLSVAKGRTR